MRYVCFMCDKSVTSELPEDAVIRAVLICPECLELAEPTRLDAVLKEIEAKVKERFR